MSRIGKRYHIIKFSEEELKTIEECCSCVEEEKKNFGNEYYAASRLRGPSSKEKKDPYRVSDIYTIGGDTIMESLLMEKVQLVNKESGWNLDITRVQKPQHSEYPVGGHYDWHTDQHILPVNQEVRKISMTLFLNNDDEYEGGELDLEIFGPAKDHNEETKVYRTFHGLPDGEGGIPFVNGKPLVNEGYIPEEKDENRYVSFKYKKGIAVFFPSCDWHRVRPVTSGTRRALVGWFAGPPYV
tara:strand:- start:307 stop:1029 length:723 start_codon:yes stop_codon:yes gene_type:complete